ncbi:MAG TPA: tetratricopeptide repeat protein [Thermoanaerobaculia bacterium]|jgi:tetratricopeptide (TPR) repeat protein
MPDRPPSPGSPFDPTTPLSRDVTTPHGAIGEHRFAAGEVLAGRYRIVGVAGAGGMGVVYEADDLELHERIALKTLHAGAAADERDVARLRREVQLARRVTHPNICRIYDVGRHEDIVFVTMELLEGDTLTGYLSARGRLTPGEGEHIMRQLCAGLQAAHDAGVIHRDFKSGNVMLVRRGSDLRAVITDFGLARTAIPTLDALASHTGSIVGTPAYMAPEQIEGAELTPAVDIYALGVVAFELITGEMPFRDASISGLLKRLRDPAPTPRLYVADVDRRWEAVIARCLQREPRDRFASPAEVARALSEDPPPPPTPRRNWRLPAAIGLALLLAIAGAMAVAYFAAKPKPAAAPVAAKAPRRSVAILGFRNLSPSQEAAWLSTALAEMLATELSAAESLRIIPGEEIARAKRDLGLDNVESHAAATLAKIRGATGADFVVAGSYVVLPQRNLRLDVRVQRTSGGETAAAFGTAGTEGDLFTLVSRAGEELRSRLGADARLAEGLDLRRAVPVNSEAARHFAAGVARLRAYDAAGARDALEQAIAADPQFALAYGELADAYSILGYDDRAAAAARKAVELSGRLPRRERLLLDAQYHQHAHQVEKAIDLYRSLVAQFPDDVEYRMRLVNVLVFSGNGNGALKEIPAMRKLAPHDPRVDLLESWGAEAKADTANMLAAADRAIARARAVGNRDVLAEAMIIRGISLSITGRIPEALAAFDEADDLFGATGNRAGIAKSLRKRSFIDWRQGNFDEARRMNERALKIYRELGQQAGMASSIGALGVMLNTQGKHDAARENFTKALEIYRRIGDRQNITWALSSLAGTYAMQNQPDEALRRYGEALVSARAMGDQNQVANTLANIGITHTFKGDITGAEPPLIEALALFRKLGDKSSEAEVEAKLGDLAFVKGDLRASRARHELSMKLRRELRESVADNQVSLSYIELAEGNAADALAQATAAASVYQAQEQVHERARTLTVVARAYADLGRTADARKALKDARALIGAVENPEVEFYLQLQEARLDSNLPALEKLIARTAEAKLVDVNFDARLELAKAELRAGRRDSALARAAALAKDAEARGYGLMASRARLLK